MIWIVCFLNLAGQVSLSVQGEGGLWQTAQQDRAALDVLSDQAWIYMVYLVRQNSKSNSFLRCSELHYSTKKAQFT